jgi:hypothetical protein
MPVTGPVSQKGIRYIREFLEYSKDIINRENYSNVKEIDILGFDIPKGATAFLPHIRCVPTTALLPLYDTLIVGIPHFKNMDDLRKVTGLTLEEIISLSQKGRLILYFDVDCPLCLIDMSPLIEQLIDNNVNFFFSVLQATALCLKVAAPIGVDIKSGREMIENANWDNKALLTMAGYRNYLKNFGFTEFSNPYLVFPEELLNSTIKPTAEYLKFLRDSQNEIPSDLEVFLSNRLKVTPNLILSRAFSSNFSTNVDCRRFIGLEATPKAVVPINSSETQEIDPFTLDFIEKKLSIAYSSDMNLSEYSDLFDSE